jgi:multicomponent Na+:H+ antiporter subunit E
MRKLTIYITSYIIWLLLSWPFNPADLQDIIAGLLVSIIPALLFGRRPEAGTPAFTFKRAGWALLYIPVLAYNMLLANLDVLYRIISPERPINPGIIKISTNLKNPLARAILANSITLTPGTLTVDIKENVIYVHWINITTSSQNVATKKIAGRFEGILKKVFE